MMNVESIYLFIYDKSAQWHHFYSGGHRRTKSVQLPKIRNCQNLSHVLKTEHTFPQVHNCMIYNFTTRKQQNVSASSLPASSSLLAFLMQQTSFTMVSTPDSWRKPRILFSQTLELVFGQCVVLIQLIRPKLDSFAATLTHAFTHTLATTRPDVQLIVHAKDSAFTTASFHSANLLWCRKTATDSRICNWVIHSSRVYLFIQGYIP